MARKGENALILEDKIDLGRTTVMLRARRWIRREKDAVDDRIRKQHLKELGGGVVRTVGELGPHT